MSEQNKTTELYGLDDWERLETDVEDVIERVIDDACEVAGESFDAIAAQLSWPIRVRVYRHMPLPEPEKTGRRMVEELLERLDEEYGDPDGGYTEPTAAMLEAATACAKAILKEYVPFVWVCEPTEAIIEVSQDEARDMVGE